ncbi:MAG TPA: PocR ligand-binding domain-containing protein [Anaerolineaceae bacterium]|nr:PocR ligand-binding domain-containing protein [Anaerolineaceae bacterium]
MSELLTTKQLQKLLKIDRITVYRMLNDGRLKGVKIGNQWRFSQNEIDRILGEKRNKVAQELNDEALSDFPSSCVQNVQEIFAGIIGIGAITVTLNGEPLTQPTHCGNFCKLIQSTPSGLMACQASWRKIALHATGEPPFQVCHAGLCYKRSIINLENDQPAAWLVAGQFYISPLDREKEAERLEGLANKHNLPYSQLKEAASKIPVLTRAQQELVQEWTPKVAATIHSILCERADLMNRLQRIAEISMVRPTLSKQPDS